MDDYEEPFMDIDKDLDWDLIRRMWGGADTQDIGRLLRAHLVVEHFMNERLVERNPNLLHLETARLGFRQKLTLLGDRGPMSLLHRGIARLNTIRNRVAHRLDHKVTEPDVAPLFDPEPHFRQFLESRTTIRKLPPPTPIDIIEGFGEFATFWLHAGTRLSMKSKAFEAKMEAERLKLAEERGVIRGQRELLAEWKASLDEDDTDG